MRGAPCGSGWGNVGYHRARSPTGPSPEVVTPNIDNLVATGIELDRLCEFLWLLPALTCHPHRCRCSLSPSGARCYITCPGWADVRESYLADLVDTYKFCSPSRSSLLTGRFPLHVNIHNMGLSTPGSGIPLGNNHPNN
jgi:hypothetical protein